MAAPYPFHTATASYNMVETSDPTQVKDQSEYANDGYLFSPAVWTPLGLKLDGSQAFSLPDKVIVQPEHDFTIFMVLRIEAPLEQDALLLIWADNVAVSFDTSAGVMAAVGEIAISSFIQPQINSNLAIAFRYNAATKESILQIAENSPSPRFMSTKGEQHPNTYIQHNGGCGQAFVGTYTHLAIFDKYCSSGQVGEMFSNSYKTLLTRGADLVAPFMQNNINQPGAFQ